MNEKIMKEVGFGKEVELIKEGKCPFCKEEIDLTKFRDDLSRREFKISGLCQDCQDKTFGK